MQAASRIVSIAAGRKAARADRRSVRSQQERNVSSPIFVGKSQAMKYTSMF
jgi:hypothetical protein